MIFNDNGFSLQRARALVCGWGYSVQLRFCGRLVFRYPYVIKYIFNANDNDNDSFSTHVRYKSLITKRGKNGI